jgi:hypothetical protein
MQKQNELGFPLHTIKKLMSVSSGYTTEGNLTACGHVNILVRKGWVLLGMHTVEYGASEKQYAMVYTLGSTDPNADDKVTYSEMNEEGRKRYTTPEEFYGERK